MDKTSLFGWATVIATAVFLLAFAVMPSLVIFAIPLFKASGFAASVITLLLFVSPIAAATGGGLLIAHKPSAGGITTALAGIGMLIAWWGPIGWLLGPLFLIAGAIGLGLWGKHGVVTLVLPLLLYSGVAAIFSPASVELKLAKTEVRISEVAGTLRWQDEWPPLKAERERLRALVDVTKEQFRIALIAASLLGGIGALSMAAKLKGSTPVVTKSLFYGGWLCLLQGVLVLLGVAPLLW